MAGPGTWAMPTSDIDNAGSWTLSTGSTIYTLLDTNWTENTSLTYVSSPAPASNAGFRLGFATHNDPGENDGHRISWYGGKFADRQADVTLQPYNDTTAIGSGTTWTAISNTFANYSFELSAADVSGTPGWSYTTLRADLEANHVGGGAVGSVQVNYFVVRVWGDTFNGYKSVDNDDYETNDESYAISKQTTGTTGSIALNSTTPISGSYDLLATHNASSDDNHQECLVYHFSGMGEPDLPANEIFTVAFRFKWVSWTQGGYNTGQSKGPLLLKTPDGEMCHLSVGGTRTLYAVITEGDSAVLKGSSGQTFTIGTEYEIRIVVDKAASNGTMSWYVDGTLIETVTNTAAGTGGIQGASDRTHYLYVGAGCRGQWEKAQYSWQIDDVMVFMGNVNPFTADQTIDVPLKSLTLTPYAPTVTGTTQTITVPLKSLTLTPYAPTVTVTDHQTIAVPLQALTYTGYAPTVTVTDHQTIAVPLQSLTLTPYAPTVTATDHQTIAVPLQSLTYTGYAPTVDAPGDVSITVPLKELTYTGHVPTVNVGGAVSITVPLQSLTLSAYAPTVTVTDHQTITVPLQALTLTPYAPTVTATDHQTISVPLQALAYTGYAPTITTTEHVSIDVPVRSLALSLFAPVISGAEVATTYNDAPPGIAKKLLDLQPIERQPSVTYQLRQEQQARLAAEAAAAELRRQREDEAARRVEALLKAEQDQKARDEANRIQRLKNLELAKMANEAEAARQAEINKARRANLRKARAKQRRMRK